jgi:uncharacterized protein (DUF362 family)
LRPALAATSTPSLQTARPRRLPASPVSLVACRTYGDAEIRAALAKSFDLIGGLNHRVAGKSVTIKVNLTGQEFSPFMGRPVGETYMTHFATVHHLTALLVGAGASRVTIVESTGRRTPLEPTLVEAGWDLNALGALGKVRFEDTRNRGSYGGYATLRVPSGLMFDSVEVNRAYAETDVVVSLAKLKQHDTTGVTLTMKNMFGITPSSMYGGIPGDEGSTRGRQAIHSPRGYVDLVLPGLKPGFASEEAGVRVPYTTVDLCAARPIDIAIVDGITAINRGESRYSAGPLMRVTTPGVLIVGTNPVAVDAVGTAVMGFDPRAPKATGAFAKARSENTLLLAEQRGLGPADLRRIDLRGLTIDEARHPYS